MDAEFIARLEHHFRPFLTGTLSPLHATQLYSASRERVIEWLSDAKPERVRVPANLSRTLWGIHFRSPIGNAAGMFKYGEGYEVSERQGAGYVVWGTATANKRLGNVTNIKVPKPFVPYARSRAASNKLGLPNPGDDAVASLLSQAQRVPGCPLIVSTASDDGVPLEKRLPALAAGMLLYDAAGADGIEVNESCPNTAHGQPSYGELKDRLTYLSREVLSRRNRMVPVIVKFSNDTKKEQVPTIMEMLFELGYDGVNFGNTSTNYAGHRNLIDPKDLKLYDWYTKEFGGGLSGVPLRNSSSELTREAARVLRAGPPDQEFHIARTGGIIDGMDVKISEGIGASLCGWYTGYFGRFAEDGHNLYKNVYEEHKRA